MTPPLAPAARAGFAAVLLSIAFSAAATTPREPRVANGIPTNARPTVGALLFGAAGPPVCSATLVGCQTLVTAAHCVCGEAGATCDPDESDYRVFLQHAGLFGVDQITPHPGFVDFPAAANDIAVVRLDRVVEGIAPTPLQVDPTPVGSMGTLVGFGDIEDATGAGAGIKREGGVVTTGCGPVSLPDSQFVCWDPTPPFGPPGTDSNTCPADSGGPLFVEESGRTVVGGAISFRLGACEGDSFGGAAHVENYAGWIASVAGGDLSTEACSDLPPVGDAAVQTDGFNGMLAGTGTESTHSFAVAPGTVALRVTLNGQTDAVEDYDLQVRQGAAPAPGRNDCEAETFSSFEECILTAPEPGDWYATVRGALGGGNYQITATSFGAGTTCGDGIVEGDETCDDGNTLAGDGCDPLCGVVAGAPCTTEPIAECVALPSGSTSLKLKAGSRPGKDRLQWSWKPRKDAILNRTGLTDTGYALCVYAETADVPQLAFDGRAPAGPLWSDKGKGFRYRGDGQVGTLDRVKVKPTPSLKFSAKARAIPALPLAQDPGVVVQLQNEEGRCWESRYDAPAKKNDDRRFSAKVKLP